MNNFGANKQIPPKHNMCCVYLKNAFYCLGSNSRQGVKGVVIIHTIHTLSVMGGGVSHPHHFFFTPNEFASLQA